MRSTKCQKFKGEIENYLRNGGARQESCHLSHELSGLF
jgi:hypothetical protein